MPVIRITAPPSLIASLNIVCGRLFLNELWRSSSLWTFFSDIPSVMPVVCLVSAAVFIQLPSYYLFKAEPSSGWLSVGGICPVALFSCSALSNTEVSSCWWAFPSALLKLFISYPLFEFFYYADYFWSIISGHSGEVGSSYPFRAATAVSKPSSSKAESFEPRLRFSNST